jgi:hypothetical protein
VRNFTDFFLPTEHQYPTLRMTSETELKVKNFAKKIAKAKANEPIHQVDNGSEYKRWMTGFSGELAVEALLKHSFVNWNIGDSADFNVSDLTPLGLNIGIKTVEFGKFPVIHKKSTRPEIIVIKQDLKYYICGLALVKTLNQYQDDELILSPKLRARNKKSGFYGFDKLIPFRTIEELRSIIRFKNKQVV